MSPPTRLSTSRSAPHIWGIGNAASFVAEGGKRTPADFAPSFYGHLSALSRHRDDAGVNSEKSEVSLFSGIDIPETEIHDIRDECASIVQ